MSDRTAPWFRFYPADFMNGVRGMSATEVGLYQMLLCRIYEENGPVEYHPLRLSTYCGMREATFIKTFEKLVALGKLTLVEGMVMNTRAATEISNRADDLKNASRAGKASAEKRQQKQRQDSTTVQQAFNHTDTDTDKSIDGGGSVCAREADPGKVRNPDIALTDRELILEAMGVGPNGVVGPSKFIGDQGDMAEAGRWLALPGLTLPTILEEIRRIAAAKPDGAPSSFRYFTPAMQRLSGRLTAPALQPTAGPQPRASPSDAPRIRARLPSEIPSETMQ